MKRYKNILLIDDNVDDQVLFLEALKSLNQGCQCTLAGSSPDGLTKLLAYQTPDLIFLDINMPAMDGFEFIEAFQNMDCLKDNRVVIAVLSSSENPKELERIHSMGIRHIIKKHISLEKFTSLWRNEFQSSCL